ncbi:hypothetical protein YTPLAS18_15890 [Nitrospira sp.]|nr:hypothetical protein YTPLAS18_15890 [Nitrospira sp.]
MAEAARSGGTSTPSDDGRMASHSDTAADIRRSKPLEENGEERRRRRIAERAYALYEERGRAQGNDVEHWLEAEREMDGMSEQWDH